MAQDELKARVVKKNPACCALFDHSASLIAFGVHHKAGTHLLKVTESLVLAAMHGTEGKVARNMSKATSKQPACPNLHGMITSLSLTGLVRPDPNLRVRRRCGSLIFFGRAPALGRTVSLFHFNEFNIEDSLALGHAGRDFRLVHVVRDPLSMVVSGYWYHLNHTDAPEGISPRILQRTNLSNGLTMNARAQLPLLRKMVGAANLLAADRRRVLTLGYEDFESWSAVAQALASFLFDNDGLPAHAHATQRLLTARSPWRSPFKNAGRDAYDQRALGPRASLSQEAVAFQAIEKMKNVENDEFRELRLLRMQLGYVQVQAQVGQDGWRYAPSVLRNADASLRTHLRHLGS